MNTRYIILAAFLLVVVIAAAISGSFAAGEWYFLLHKPQWTIPTWAFGPAWAAVYVLMAAAMWMVWASGHHQRTGALTWWLLQLGLVIAWSWLFFGMNRSGWSMGIMLLLIGFVLFCIKLFATPSRLAALLLVPCLLWLVYLWVWNIAIWLLNGGGFGVSID
jgi:tryptophan-rich sensory protein